MKPSPSKPIRRRKPGGGRKPIDPNGLIRHSRTFAVTDAEYSYLREALEYRRASQQQD